MREGYKQDPIVEYWQKVLRLQDWEIELVERPVWNDPDVTGLICIHQNSKTARIIISDAANYNGSFIEPYDREVIIVHELLHIPLDFLAGAADVDNIPTLSAALEVTIDLTAQALVGLRRKAEGIFIA